MQRQRTVSEVHSRPRPTEAVGALRVESPRFGRLPAAHAPALLQPRRRASRRARAGSNLATSRRKRANRAVDAHGNDESGDTARAARPKRRQRTPPPDAAEDRLGSPDVARTRFSVVVAAFNASATIGQTIRSVFQQTADDFELIIVDDGSTDDTARRARSLAEDRRVQVITQRNQGASVARNTGIAEASGSFISLLDADDIWLPSYLEEMGRALDAEPDAGFAYTDAWLMNDVNHKVRRTSTMFYEDPPDPPPQAPRDFFLRLLERNFVYNSVTVRRSIIDEVGGYDESLRTCEDYEMWMRIAANGIRVVRPHGPIW